MSPHLLIPIAVETDPHPLFTPHLLQATMADGLQALHALHALPPGHQDHQLQF
jgi:hypothetical protein